MSTEIIPFLFEGAEVRATLIDGEPWWALGDVTKALGLSNPSAVAARLDPDEKGVTQIETLGGVQTVGIVNEPGLYSVVLRSDKPEAKRFKRWVTHVVIPSLRKTGSYSVVEKSPMDIIRDQHQAVAMLLEENESLTVRAVQAESTVETIEGGDGLSVRQFHKQYFSETSEHEFNDLLYRKRLLIDQRGTRGRDSRGRLKNGKEHRHPTFIGKPFFYLEPTIDRETGDRYYQTKVRPGTPEVELIHYLEKQGLEANRNIGRALSAVNS